jgi:hypothetical protein
MICKNNLQICSDPTAIQSTVLATITGFLPPSLGEEPPAGLNVLHIIQTEVLQLREVCAVPEGGEHKVNPLLPLRLLPAQVEEEKLKRDHLQVEFRHRIQTRD